LPPFVPERVNIDPVFLTAGPIWPEHTAAPVLLAKNDLLPQSNRGQSSPPTPSAPSYPLPQPGYPTPLSATTPEPGSFLLFLSSLMLLPLLIHLRRIH
jgi:hypothetical protein